MALTARQKCSLAISDRWPTVSQRSPAYEFDRSHVLRVDGTCSGAIFL